MILSKIGAMGSAEASTALISIMNGYKMATEDAAHVVDSLTAVDMKAATSADELRKALQRTSNTAREAGVEYNTLVGYIGTVSEATRLAPERIGTAFKTIFSRLGNVKAGKFIDNETGEALNDVEKVLNKLGIKLRENENDWRKAQDVIDDVAKSWEGYTQKERNALATAISGSTQREMFISLMENYNRAIELTGVSTDSAGQSAKKYETYMQSLEATLKKLQTTWDSIFFNERTVTTFKVLLDGVDALLSAFKNAIVPAIFVMLPVLFERIKAMNMANEVNKIAEATKGLGYWQQVQLANLNQLTPAMVVQKSISQGLSESKFKEIVASLSLTDIQKQEALSIWANTTAKTANVGVTNTLITSLKALSIQMLASPFFWITLATIAITTFVSVLEDQSKELEKAQEHLSKVNDEYKKITEQLKSSDDELKKINDRLDVLNSKKSLTLIEQSEIEKLKSAKEELQIQIGLLKQQEDIKAKEKNKAASDAVFAAKNKSSDLNTGKKLEWWQTFLEGGVSEVFAPVETDFDKFLANAETKLKQFQSRMVSNDGINKNPFGSPFGSKFSMAKETDKNSYEEAKKSLSDYAKVLQESIDSTTILNDEDKTRVETWKKQRDEIYKLINASGYLNVAFEKIRTNSENTEFLTKIYSEINGLSFSDFSKNFADDFKIVKQWSDGLNISVEDLYNHLLTLSKSKDTVPEFDFSSGMSDINKTISELKSAYQEIEKGGDLSVGTISELLSKSEDWQDVLIDENGKIINNAQVFKDAVNDKISTMIKDLDARREYLKGLFADAQALSNLSIEEAVIRKRELMSLDEQRKYLEALKNTNLFSESGSDKKSRADAEIESSKYAYEMGEISEAQHFKNLERIRDKYFKKGSDEWKKYALEIKQYQDKVRLETLKEQEDDYKKAASAITKILEDQKKKIEDKYNAEIEALKNLNTQKEKDLSLEKARLALSKAQTEETRMVFVKGQGFVRKKDETAIKDAQEEVDKLSREQKIADLEVQRDKEVKTVQDKIDIWKSISDEFTNSEDKAMAQKLLGANWENDIFNDRLDNFRRFRDDYLKIQQSILDAEAYADGKTPVNVLQYAGKSYANGGLMDYTGVANIHGTPDKPEIALNNSQAAGLYNWIKSLSYPSLSTIGLNSGASKSGTEYIFKDIKVYPNDFDDFVRKMTNKANVTGR